MTQTSLRIGSAAVLEIEDFQKLIDSVRAQGFRVAGPKIEDGAVVYREILKVEDLPIGYIDSQAPGKYRLEKSDSGEIFGYVVGPDSWKRFLYPPRLRLWSVTRSKSTLSIHENDSEPERWAFLGVRPCELAAIAVQDAVFLEGDYKDSYYKAVRDQCFVIVVQCARAADTCFCTSMNTGPRAGKGFDLALTEILSEERHYFLVEIGSESGLRIVADLDLKEAGETDIQAAHAVTRNTENRIRRKLDTEDIRGVLGRQFENRRWDEIADRCLACANCTQVCPTCFCSTVEDTTDLSGERAERWRHWDSCFTGEFSYIHGGTIRSSVKSRYRQWLCHKLSYWLDQFGTSGCVGCGRCITWCPVGIDLTEEIRVFHEIDSASGKPTPEEVEFDAND